MADIPLDQIDDYNNNKRGMACLWKNTITGLSASSEVDGYPVENVLDEHPKKIWKSVETGKAVTEFYVSAGSNALAIFGTNAHKVRVVITNPNAIEWETDVEWEPGVEWESVDFVGAFEYELTQQGHTYALWIDFPPLIVGMKISIEYRTLNYDQIEVGILRAGRRVDFINNPLRGLTESLIDYSITKELSNGAIYVKKRDIVRNFSGQIFVDREPYFYNFLYDVSREIGLVPAAWKITDMNLCRWIVFGQLAMPSGSHLYTYNSTISFNIKEVI